MPLRCPWGSFSSLHMATWDLFIFPRLKKNVLFVGEVVNKNKAYPSKIKPFINVKQKLKGKLYINIKNWGIFIFRYHLLPPSLHSFSSCISYRSLTRPQPQLLFGSWLSTPVLSTAPSLFERRQCFPSLAPSQKFMYWWSRCNNTTTKWPTLVGSGKGEKDRWERIWWNFGGGRTRVGLYGDRWAIVSLQFRIELIFGDLWFKTCR